MLPENVEEKTDNFLVLEMDHKINCLQNLKIWYFYVLKVSAWSLSDYSRKGKFPGTFIDLSNFDEMLYYVYSPFNKLYSKPRKFTTFRHPSLAILLRVLF